VIAGITGYHKQGSSESDIITICVPILKICTGYGLTYMELFRELVFAHLYIGLPPR
jgi:hypothetical protein